MSDPLSLPPLLPPAPLSLPGGFNRPCFLASGLWPLALVRLQPIFSFSTFSADLRHHGIQDEEAEP